MLHSPQHAQSILSSGTMAAEPRMVCSTKVPYVSKLLQGLSVLAACAARPVLRSSFLHSSMK
jgi:hypothetical protein